MQQESTLVSWNPIAKLRRFLHKLRKKDVAGVAVADYIAGGTFTDPRDGKTYRTVKIGNQTWMAENLNFECPGSKCYYDDPDNAKKYGRLYTWYDAKACPRGWHLPSEEDWNKLNDCVGGEKISGTKFKAKSGWNKNGNGNGNCKDDYGFSALPGGFGHAIGSFGAAGEYGYWWSASEINAFGALSHGMGFDNDGALWGCYDKCYLFSVRYVQDSFTKQFQQSRFS